MWKTWLVMVAFWAVFLGLAVLDDTLGYPPAQKQQAEPTYVCGAEPREGRERTYVCRPIQHDPDGDDEREPAKYEPPSHRRP